MARKFLAALTFSLLGAASAHAQQISNARVLAGSCGTTAPFAAINPGQTAGLFMDSTGHLCSSATGGGGGSGPLGTQPISNSQAVNPATASVWQVNSLAGAFASGSFLAGAYADGAITTIGTEADTAWTTGNGTVISILKKIANNGGGGGGAVPSFQVSGTPLNIPSVTSTSANFALPPGTNVVLYNYGGYKIIYQLSTSGASAVTQANAEGILGPGGTAEVAVGSNTNIAVATTSSSLVSALQIAGGAGLWTGSSNNNLSVSGNALTGPGFSNQIGGVDNAGLLQPFGSTAAGVSSTKGVVPVQGVTGGVPQGIAGAAGAFVSGSFLSGAFADGAINTMGTQADTAWASGSGTEIAILKKIANNTNTFTGAVTIASGGVAAGAYSVGAFVSGSFLAGAYADGSITTIGTEADTAWASGSGTVIAILKKIAGNTAVGGAVTIAAGADVSEGNITDTAWSGTGNSTVIAALKAIYNAATGSIAAGSAIIGKVGIDQSTPGTTNGIFINGCVASVCGLPTITNNALVFGSITTPMTVTTTTSLIAAVTSQHIYVDSISCQGGNAVGTLVQVIDGASTVIGNLAVGATLGGDNRQPGPTPHFVTSIGNALQVKNVTTGASVTCNASGHSSAS